MSLSHRALPHIELLTAAARECCDVKMKISRGQTTLTPVFSRYKYARVLTLIAQRAFRFRKAISCH